METKPDEKNTGGMIIIKLVSAIAERFGLIVIGVFYWATADGVQWTVTECVRALSGKTTTVNATFNAEQESPWIIWILAALVLILAISTFTFFRFFKRERRDKQEKVEYLTQRIQFLEHLVDPHRTSSKLLPTGQSRPED